VSEPAQSLFDQSAAPYTVWFEDHFISFSPEAFITVAGDQIATTPMKGTGFDAARLMADAKEQAEHATVVDLLRNDLGRVAANITVGEYRYLSAIPQAAGRTLYQTSTRITGEMPANWRATIGEWLPKLLPAGSITGAPKKKTIELIHKYETEPRGFFTGVAVLFDGENLMSSVLIRYLDLTTAPLKFRSGAGITIYSDPAEEYQEILNKVYIPV
jgi:para-aminobenzoate synthetase component 1